MPVPTEIPFAKMHGIGNDFVMVDLAQTGELDWPKLAESMCNRHTGVGSDGLIIMTNQGETLEMRMFNPDGSESEMCGNGIRCFALYAREHGRTVARDIPVITGAGLLHLKMVDGARVQVDMGEAILGAERIGMAGATGHFIDRPLEADGIRYCGTAVSMGNPHLVIFTKDVRGIDLEKVGSILEHSPYFPNRVNVHFVQVESQNHIIQRTWERGAGITLACGTGACACAVASYINGHTSRQVRVSLPGGDLEIEYLESGKVLMTGPAVKVFDGSWPA